MRTFVLVIVALTCNRLLAVDRELIFSARAAAFTAIEEAIFQELSAGLPKDNARANSARFELEYWHQHSGGWFLPEQKELQTQDGKPAEVILLNVPSLSIPGTDFTMAFLLIDKKIIDWASCWTSNRNAMQELLLEDVDGDGAIDLGFRYKPGCWGKDKRVQALPGGHEYLYAYKITSQGLKSIFPSTEHDLPVKIAYDTGKLPLKIEVRGLPATMRERQLYECTITLTNNSDQEMPIKSHEWHHSWYKLETKQMSWSLHPQSRTDLNFLKPGASVTEVLRLSVEDHEKEAALCWKFVPIQER